MEFTGIIPEYNIDWCFFTIYILIVLVYPNINKFIIKYNKKLIVYLSFIFLFNWIYSKNQKYNSFL